MPRTARASISEDEGERVEVCLRPSFGRPSSPSTLSVVSEDGTAIGNYCVLILKVN